MKAGNRDRFPSREGCPLIGKMSGGWRIAGSGKGGKVEARRFGVDAGGWHTILPYNYMRVFFLRLYDVFQFTLQFWKEVFLPPYEVKEVFNQAYEVGIRSLSIITLTGFITGVVFTKQSRSSLAEFGATSWLPSLMAIALLRALAPLVTALIVAGKVGSNIGAEIGSMRVSEQIDAMEVSSTNPFKFLVVTRVLATTFIVPLLATYMGFVGLMGAFLNVYRNEQTS